MAENSSVPTPDAPVPGVPSAESRYGESFPTDEDLSRRGSGRAAVSPEEFQSLGGEIPVRQEPSPQTPLEFLHPPATDEDLRALAGLPSSSEELCGAVGPAGETCRLRRGHNAGEAEVLHVARGRSWTGIAGRIDSSFFSMVQRPVSDPNTARIAVALERGVELLDRLTKSIEHYVEDMLHRQR
jgi:hypothetical protein